MSEPEPSIRPVDFITFLEKYLNEVRGGGDRLGAYQAAQCLYASTRVRPKADLNTMFSMAWDKYNAGLKPYRPRSLDEDEADELEIMRRENPNLTAKTYHLT